MHVPSKVSCPSSAVLAITQLIGWGTISLPAVIGEQLARDLGLALPAVFAGTTVMLVVTGLTSPLMANAFVKYGARLVMAAGSSIAVPGFLLLARASGPSLYYAGWVVLGRRRRGDAVDGDLHPAQRDGRRRSQAADRRAHAGDGTVVERVLADHRRADGP